MATKLNQIVAIEKGVRSSVTRTVTDCYHTIQRQGGLSGISRTYIPRDDDGDMMPPESTLVQTNTNEVLQEAARSLTRLFDVYLTKEDANMKARADVIVDGETILANVPVTYLLFLQRQLVDFRTLISKLPTLDPSERWHLDTTTNAWATEPTQTLRTKKVPRNWVKAEATDKHPAQVEMYHEDVPVGTWTTVKFSGAMPVARVTELLTRVETLMEAVRFARETANGMDIEDVGAGAAIFNHLLAP